MSATTSTVEHAGVKRKPEDIGDHERLTKRFDLLNISPFLLPRCRRMCRSSNHCSDSNRKQHYIPVSGEANATPAPPVSSPANGAGLMEVEDRPDRIFIHDLDAELAELESDEDKPIFLPDIEKHLNKLPPHLLRSHDPHSQLGQANDRQLVLYQVPQSVSLPNDADSVRKAIIESRNRARLETRAKIKREQRGDMDIEDMSPPTSPRVLARLKWKDVPPDEGNPESMNVEAYQRPVDNETVDEDAMELG